MARRHPKTQEDLRVVLDLREKDEVIDLREKARREWEDSADLVRYDHDAEAIRLDARRESVVPRDVAARR